MVRAGLGWAVLPWLALHGSDAWSDDRLTIHELQPAPAREIYLHWPTGSQSPLAVRAIEIATEVAADLTERRVTQVNLEPWDRPTPQES